MTNLELVSIAMDIYNNLQTVYAKGGIGWKLTESRLNYLRNQYEWNKEHLTNKDLGKYACDCSGMIVGMAYDGWRINQEPVWTRDHDWNDQMIGDKLTDCVSPDKAVPGMCLWKKGHVGLVIFDGYELDSTTDSGISGIHKRKISDVKWEKAGKLPEIEYSNVKIGDVIPMTVTSISNGKAYGEAKLYPLNGIQVGDSVTIDPGAKSGGMSKKYRGKPIDPKYANGKYVDVVTKIEEHYGVEEALLRNINTWVAISSLKLAK